MIASTEAGFVASAVAPPAPTPVRDATEPRAIEPTEQGALQTESRESSLATASAVLQVLKDSAEAFAALMQTLDSVESAAAMTGFRAPVTSESGATVDVYA